MKIEIFMNSDELKSFLIATDDIQKKINGDVSLTPSEYFNIIVQSYIKKEMLGDL